MGLLVWTGIQERGFNGGLQGVLEGGLPCFRDTELYYILTPCFREVVQGGQNLGGFLRGQGTREGVKGYHTRSNARNGL
jgi:hypothetical protein